MKIKTITDIQEFVQYTKDFKNFNHYGAVQTDLLYNKNVKKFVEYLISLSEISRIDELDCTKSWRRQVSDKGLDYVLPILTDDNTLKAGLKIDYKPKFKYHDWDSWGWLHRRVCMF